jgi:DNA polymerase
MTGKQKGVLVTFLDRIEDSLRDGYRCRRAPLLFEDDPPAEVFIAEAPGGTAQVEAGTVPAAPGAGKSAPGAGETEPAKPSGPDVPPAPADSPEAADSLEKITAEVLSCSFCVLGTSRTKGVPGEGAARPLVMVIGEGPGAEEDASGRPFVGPAGRLLDRMLASIGLSREKNCFIANVVKCRPPGNRDPRPEEIEACAPFLVRQIGLLKPPLVLSLGRVATQALLKTELPIGRLRGTFTNLSLPGLSPIPLLPSYHPSALLRDEALKKPAFEDLKQLFARLVLIDRNFAEEAEPLVRKYAAQDEDFARRVEGLLP